MLCMCRNRRYAQQAASGCGAQCYAQRPGQIKVERRV